MSSTGAEPAAWRRRHAWRVSLAMVVSTALVAAVTALAPPAKAGTEPVVINTSVHDAADHSVTSVPLGTVVHDMAAIQGSSGVVTGDVRVHRYSNGTCSGPATARSAWFRLVAGWVDAIGFAWRADMSGDFAFRAEYSGDATYAAAKGPCERFTVTPVDPTVTLTYWNDAGQMITQIEAGWAFTARVHVEGLPGMTPTGTVRLIGPSAGSCEGGPFSGKTLSSNGNAVFEFPHATAPYSGPGAIAFYVIYLGDGRYRLAASECELLQVTLPVPSIDFAIHDPDHDVANSVPAGTELHASVRLSGGVGVPTGEVHVTEYSRRDCRGIVGELVQPLDAGGAEIGPFAGPAHGDTRWYQVYYKGYEPYDEATSECLKVTFVERATPTPAPTPTSTAAPVPTGAPTPFPTPSPTDTPATSPTGTPPPATSPIQTATSSPSPVPAIVSPAPPTSGDSTTGALSDLLPWLLLAGLVLLNLVVGAFLVGRRLGHGAS